MIIRRLNLSPTPLPLGAAATTAYCRYLKQQTSSLAQVPGRPNSYRVSNCSPRAGTAWLQNQLPRLQITFSFPASPLHGTSSRPKSTNARPTPRTGSKLSTPPVRTIIKISLPSPTDLVQGDYSRVEDVTTTLEAVSRTISDGEVLIRQACYKPQIKKHDEYEEVA